MTYPNHRATFRAFTLVELLVTISVIALLIAILLPSLTRARESTRRILCATNTRQLAFSTLIYCNDYNGTPPYAAFDSYGRYCFLPTMRSHLYRNYSLNKLELWYCPSGVVRGVSLSRTMYNHRFIWDPTYTNLGAAENNRAMTNYGYFAGPGRTVLNHGLMLRIDSVKKPSQRILWVDPLKSPGARNGSFSPNWPMPCNTHDSNGNFIPEGANHAMVDGHSEWREYRYNANTTNWISQYYSYVP